MGANATTFVPAYVSGEVLTAADLTVTNSGIPVFADSTARDNSFGGTGEKTLAEGQAAFIEGSGLQIYNGTVWRPYGYRQTFTPSFTNFTLGNGTVNYATFAQVDDFVYVEVKVTLGSTSVMGTGPTFTLPVTSTQQTAIAQMGPSRLEESGVSAYGGFVYSGNGSTTATLGVMNVGSNYPTYVNVSATVPFTWGNTDVFEFNLSYTV